ncbi:cysteine-rich CWC family protein [Aurantibacillus circumpalustris]|uniref:cysteine-rich CWC family protein n=1 Tax=Aurantibacillus circumpalustris TaxID=3036359 RepID=UPI00295AFCF5|nr:cysteine-rich CWC family protein [Aurantibacillus circumpalustris]
MLDRKEEETNCPRCEKKFICNPNDISACNCSKVELTTEEYRFISSQFKICVCNVCLKDLKDEYNKKFHYNKPNNFKDRTYSIFLLFVLFFEIMNAQTYAPSVGQAGTTAIHKDSSVFVNWAVASQITRGYQNISNPSLGFATSGDNAMATGKAEGSAVSLGDGGYAICTFEKSIRNDAGFDFAVFENGFDDVFLELAFVEVSSDGVNFFRFKAHSLSDTVAQTNGFGSTDATKINNLAGKYRGGYGTPFDLQELAGTVGLDVNAITHVKIIDVVGSLNNNYASRDFNMNKINDPWPTPFPSGGFDLDAVGVIHQSTIAGIHEDKDPIPVSIYPNPVKAGEFIYLDKLPFGTSVELQDASGKIIVKVKLTLEQETLHQEKQTISTKGLCVGLYSLKIISGNTLLIKRVIVSE